MELSHPVKVAGASGTNGDCSRESSPAPWKVAVTVVNFLKHENKRKAPPLDPLVTLDQFSRVDGDDLERHHDLLGPPSLLAHFPYLVLQSIFS